MANLHSTFLFFSALLLPLFLLLVSSTPDHHQNPDAIVQDVNRKINNASLARRGLGYLSCSTGNPIDDCWRCDPNWEKNRQRLADCAIGFGKDALGGKNGRVYVVTDSGDDDPVNPKPGTLRHAVIQDEPLWITFQRDMVIQLKQELVMNSYKTIDGRGASVHISGGPCITIHYATNIIIHGIHVHDWKHIWVDHCSLSNCHDGLVDAIHGSTAITISNNYFTHHDKVMLLGHSDAYTLDKNMQVTVAFNHFGEGLVQRMPRCRHGYFHVVNNDYTHWELYAIGGSASPTINSQGNRFLASDDRFRKEVTKHEDAAESEWKSWNWRSEGDLMLNGAYFRQSGAGASASTYARASSLSARPSSLVASITTAAGALNCKKGSHC
nr:pectate lyase-like [Ipomoea batatas]